MKKTISFLLCMILLLGILPTAVLPAAAFTAVKSGQKLCVDGVAASAAVYNIDGANYFKLRDIAYLLNGTGSQFDVGYDKETQTMAITTGVPYTPVGVELVTNVDQSATAKVCEHTIVVDGVRRDDLTAYDIGGTCFFTLRALGDTLGFEVGYDAVNRMASITTGRAYSSPNGTELVLSGDMSATARVSTQRISIDGVVVEDIPVYNFGGNNYLRLDALAGYLNFALTEGSKIRTAVFAPPTNLTAKATSAGIALTWTPADGADGYRVWRKENVSGAAWEKVTTTNNPASFTDASVTAGKTYSYRVKSYSNADGVLSAGYSNIVKVTAK